MYNEFILTTYKELSLPGPSKANVSKGPEEESVLMASLGVSETEEHWRMTEKETTTPVLRLGRSLNDPKSPLILGLCPNHVHHRPPSLWYSFRLPLAVFYQDMEIRFSLVEVLEGSCF